MGRTRRAWALVGPQARRLTLAVGHHARGRHPIRGRPRDAPARFGAALKSSLAGPDVHTVTPSERSFLTAVIRFQTLLHAGARSTDPEFFHLRRFLGSDAPDAHPEAGERRLFRRFAAQVPATIRFGARSATCTVVDLGGGGMRIALSQPIGVVQGSPLLLSVQTRPGLERVDLAVEVRCVGPRGTWLGCEFVGAPLTLRQVTASPRVDAQAKTQEVRTAA